MSIQSRATLKSYFLTGLKPTQAQFADLIDSCLNLSEDWHENEYTQQIGAGSFNTINATTADLDLITLASNERFMGFAINVQQSWRGGLINSATAALYVKFAGNQALTSTDIFTAGGSTIGLWEAGANSLTIVPPFNNSIIVGLRVTIGSALGTARLTSLTQGILNLRQWTISNPSA